MIIHKSLNKKKYFMVYFRLFCVMSERASHSQTLIPKSDTYDLLSNENDYSDMDDENERASLVANQLNNDNEKDRSFRHFHQINTTSEAFSSFRITNNNENDGLNSQSE